MFANPHHWKIGHSSSIPFRRNSVHLVQALPLATSALSLGSVPLLDPRQGSPPHELLWQVGLVCGCPLAGLVAQGCPRQGCAGDGLPLPGLSARATPARVAPARVAPARVPKKTLKTTPPPPPGLPRHLKVHATYEPLDNCTYNPTYNTSKGAFWGLFQL